MTKTVLILGGSGKIGSHTAEAFWNAGWTVRQYKRGTDMTAAAMGADVIVNGLNPPAYHNWARLIPEITAQVIAAAKASGATVIIPGNIYVYGDQPGTLDEKTPHKAHTRKGKIRIAMEQSYRSAGVRTIILRAGNFIDPDGNGDALSMMLMRDIAKGRVTAFGGADVMQAYAYLPDWARAALQLAEMRNTLPRFADIPFPGHSFTVVDLHKTISGSLGRPVKLARFPWILMTLLSPFWELARELREMRYLFDMPHQIGGTTFDSLLPDFRATDIRTVMLSGLPEDIHPDKMVRPSQQPVSA